MKNETKKKVTNRISRIEGQVRALRTMIESDKYCIDVINQSSAVRNALSAFEDEMLENHLSEHVIEQVKRGDIEQATDEILHVFKRSKK